MSVMLQPPLKVTQGHRKAHRLITYLSLPSPHQLCNLLVLFQMGSACVKGRNNLTLRGPSTQVKRQVSINQYRQMSFRYTNVWKQKITGNVGSCSDFIKRKNKSEPD